jgi:hypothetical protein
LLRISLLTLVARGVQKEEHKQEPQREIENMNANNTIARSNTTAIVLHIANRIRILSGVIAMILTMLTLLGWFGWNMNDYINHIGGRSTPTYASATGTAIGDQ